MHLLLFLYLNARTCCYISNHVFFLLQQYGDIRTLYTACKHRGFVMISYYDIRAARTAMRALQNKPLRRRKLDIHFSIPKVNHSVPLISSSSSINISFEFLSILVGQPIRQRYQSRNTCSIQFGSIRFKWRSSQNIWGIWGGEGGINYFLVSLLSVGLSRYIMYLKRLMQIRETPHKRHHKFIEFYDVRAAEAALRSLNRSDIAGKRIKLEPSRPGGARRKWVFEKASSSFSVNVFGFNDCSSNSWLQGDLFLLLISYIFIMNVNPFVSTCIV